MLDYWNSATPTADWYCQLLLPQYSTIPLFHHSSFLRLRDVPSPGAPSAPLSPVLNPSLGGALFRNCPTPNLDESPVFFLFRETLWFVCLTLASSPSPHKPPR
jgi:hypothetical protein